SGALKMDPIKDPDKALEVVQREFDKRFNETWFDSYGFANSYAFTIRNEMAKEKGYETISDLEPDKDTLKLGVDNSWLKRKGDVIYVLQIRILILKIPIQCKLDLYTKQ